MQGADRDTLRPKGRGLLPIRLLTTYKRATIVKAGWPTQSVASHHDTSRSAKLMPVYP